MLTSTLTHAADAAEVKGNIGEQQTNILSEDTSEDTPEEASRKILNTLNEKQKNIQTFYARARQIKHLPMLDKPVETTGYLIMQRPDKMRWVVEEPERMIAVINGTTMTVYFMDKKRARKLDLKTDFSARHTMKFFTSLMNASFDEFSKDFHLSVEDNNSVISVTLVPRSAIWAKYLGKVLLKFQKDTGAPVSMSVDWKKRGTIKTLFESSEINVDVDDKIFTLTLPSDVTVTEPGRKETEMEIE